MGPEHIDEVLGVDAGVVVTAYDPSGGTHHMPDEADATRAIKDAGRRWARCSRGSRRHDKRGLRLATMQRRRANRRRNARRHIAKALPYISPALPLDVECRVERIRHDERATRRDVVAHEPPE